jgi:hypothetical protein
LKCLQSFGIILLNIVINGESTWVALERDYIAKTNNKKILTIDIDDEDSIIRLIQQIRHNLRVYISFTVADEKLARQIKNSFEGKRLSDVFPL